MWTPWLSVYVTDIENGDVTVYCGLCVWERCPLALSTERVWGPQYTSSSEHTQVPKSWFLNPFSGQSYGFSNSHVWMWELHRKESWVLKNWCFWTVVLEKTLESPLDCKEIKPVHPKGPEYSSEGLVLKLQYFGHLMWRTGSLGKTLMLENSPWGRKESDTTEQLNWNRFSTERSRDSMKKCLILLILVKRWVWNIFLCQKWGGAQNILGWRGQDG